MSNENKNENPIETKRFVLHIGNVAGQTSLDNMMHSFDVFEPSKRLVSVLASEFSYTLPLSECEKTPEGLSDEALLKVLQIMKQSYEEKGELFISAIWFVERPYIHIVDWSVQSMSNGENWGSLRRFLEMQGIPEDRIPAKIVASKDNTILSLGYQCPILKREIAVIWLGNVASEKEGNCKCVGSHASGFAKTDACPCGILHKLEL